MSARVLEPGCSCLNSEEKLSAVHRYGSAELESDATNRWGCVCHVSVTRAKHA